MTGAGQTLSLQDIADLAGVQRSVVSMWRRRPRVRGQRMPFPDSVTSNDRPERFRRDEIIDWLARTGRGRNTAYRLDAPALGVPSGVSFEDLVTLLCLHVHTDSDLVDLTAAERVAVAERGDPRDEYLLTEVRQLAVADEVLRFVDDLVEASFGLPDTLNRLENGPAGRALGLRDLTEQAISVICAVTGSAAFHLDPEGVPVVFTGDSPSLALAVAEGARGLATVGDGAMPRALRRRAVIRDLDLVDAADPTGTTETGCEPRLRMVSALGLELDPTLNRIDDLLLELAPGEVGVAVGSAAALCERLRGTAEGFRAKMLRPGGLAAAVRLPRGWWREAHRQALGLWICTGGRTTDRPMVADLGAVPPAEISVDDIAADITAALSGEDGRAFRYLRTVELSAILARAPIVPPGTRAPRLGSSASNHLDRVQAAALAVAEPLEPLDVLVAAAPGAMLLRQRSLGELHESRAVTLLRGSRIDPGGSVPGGSITVLSADGATDGVTLDPFDAEGWYPRAHRTEPGDVVFVEGKPPQARVDDHGGSLVASPSRILRLGTAAGVGPHTLAAIINYHCPTGEWKTWSIPLLDPAEAAALESALVETSGYGTLLRQRQAALQALITALIDGVAAGAVAVIPRAVPRKDR